MGGRLQDKVAIITGGGSGIGLATAQMFHREGAFVVLTGTSNLAMDAAAALGKRASGIRGDASKAADVAAVVDHAVKTFGGLDILCNVAGASGPLSPVVETSEETFNEMIDVNLRSVRRLCQ